MIYKGDANFLCRLLICNNAYETKRSASLVVCPVRRLVSAICFAATVSKGHRVTAWTRRSMDSLKSPRCSHSKIKWTSNPIQLQHLHLHLVMRFSETAVLYQIQNLKNAFRCLKSEDWEKDDNDNSCSPKEATPSDSLSAPSSWLIIWLTVAPRACQTGDDNSTRGKEGRPSLSAPTIYYLKGTF